MLLPLFGITQKKKSCISQRVIPLLVQRTGGKENFSLSGFFTCFGRVDDRKVRALTVIMKSWKRAYKDAPQPEVLLLICLDSTNLFCERF